MKIESSDSLLTPYLQAADDAESQRLLAHLVSEHAEPVIRKIVNYKFLPGRGAGQRDGRQFEAEEVHGEVVVQLLQRLRHLKTDDGGNAINDFRGYVAAVTYNACDRFVSRKYPQRRRLKNGLRYLLTHRPGFALWKGEQETWLGGLAAWRSTEPTGGGAAFAAPAEHARRSQQLRDDPRALGGGDAGGVEPCDLNDPKNAVELLRRIFDWTGGPVEIDELVGIVAARWGVRDQEVFTASDGGLDVEDAAEVPDRRAGVASEVERRFYLQRLWREISELPERQRAAVLLNLRDEHGRGVVDLWILTAVATPPDIAGALSVSLEEFGNLLTELPFDDNRIAAHLGVTRQQVINLRKSARERLARRMKGF